MVQIRPVLFIIGLVLIGIAAAMLIPMAFDLDHGHRNWGAFAEASAATLFAGGLLAAGGYAGGRPKFTAREGFLLTAVSWFAVSAAGALPFCFSELRLSFTDAFFETASGLTTTGSTVLEKLHTFSRGLLLWRSMLQGMGGMGIVVMAVALLPFLRVGGMQLFRSESSEKSDKPLPRAAQIAAATMLAYFALMLACALVYWALGMSAFDAVTHALPTISTGGFANYDESFAAFKSPALEWAAVVFMTMGGLPLLVYVRLALGHWRDVRADTQVAWYLAVFAAAALAMAAWLVFQRGEPVGAALRLAFFNVISVLTTTGFASADYNQWGGFPAILFIMLMFIGGCAGSTAGGMKVMRFEILGKLGADTIRRLVHRRGVWRMTYQRRPVTEDVISSVTIFCFVYFLSFAALGAALGATGLDFVSSITASAQALGNIGPGLGEIVGPAGNYKTVSDPAKWLLAIGMILGRLEFMAVLVLFTRRFWRG
ncbi:MAG: TrkH family potassium uptake protein [Rhodospirillaceae bacterium]|nr:TrkH family potassium uptake protein [Rhodospirillaceae bacterium]